MTPVTPRWRQCVVAAPGPSLTPEVAEAIRGRNIFAVQDAYRRVPFADVLYGCDARWWRHHEGCPDFRGEKWSCHSTSASVDDDKAEIAEKYGVNLVRGQDGNRFSLNPEVIHYGSSSGYQAVNLAILFGATFIILVGFDMHRRNGRHFFGDHEKPLRNTDDYSGFITAFNQAAAKLPKHLRIVNATPDSALKCFPMLTLEDALEQAPETAAP